MSQQPEQISGDSNAKPLSGDALEGLDNEFEDLRVEEVQEESDDESDNKYQYKVIIVGGR